MNTILQSIDPSITYALGWTIIHSLWQASMIALIMSLVHRFGVHRSSSFRYNVSVFSMITLVIASAITFGIYYTSTATVDSVSSVELARHQLNNSVEVSILARVQSFFTENLEQINLVWGVGVLLFIFRLLFSYGYTKYLKNTAIFSNTSRLEKTLARIKNKLSIDKTIRIAESTKINVPLVVGHFKPLILFPIGMVNMLSIEEVEAVITHELAHIKRYDYLMNIAMTLIEILFYFHPAVWWISANVKAERENCCDDYALSHHIDKVIYAKALVKLEEMKAMKTPSLAMPFSTKKHQLINRIKRIMNMQQTQNDMKEKSMATILLLSIVLLFSNQANSESTKSDFFDELEKALLDTTRIAGEEEMILKVKDGKFESLQIDNEEQENEIVKEIASVVNKNSTNNNSYTMTVKESPILEIINDEVRINGKGGVIYESVNQHFPHIKGDTLPQTSNRISMKISRENGKTVEIEKENGKILTLKIDGEVIPKNEYYKYEEEIESANGIYEFDEDDNIFKRFNEEDFSKSLSLLFEGDKWREFGGNMNQLFDEDILEWLKEMEGMRFNFDLKELEDLEDLRGLEQLQELRAFEYLEEMEPLNEFFEELGIKMDSTLKGMHFNFEDFDRLEGFENFRFFKDFDDEDVRIFRDDRSEYRNGTVVDRIGKMLNKDGLLKEYKSNKIEITGKHLKINGEKMPNAIFEKYKNIYQESTGAPLTKKSKMIFDVEGKPSKRKVRTF